MTTTAFQYVFDNAESISINRQPVTGQSISRSFVARTETLGSGIWRFDVKLPDGIAWTTIRPYIETIEAAGKGTIGVVNLNNSGYNSWLTPYQGSATSITSWTASVVGDFRSNITLTSTPGYTSGTILAAGDIIQIGSTGNVYSVTANVTSGTLVPLNRTVREPIGSYALTIGPSVTWNVICIEMPKWTIFSRNQVSWSGSFVFYEYIL